MIRLIIVIIIVIIVIIISIISQGAASPPAASSPWVSERQGPQGLGMGLFSYCLNLLIYWFIILLVYSFDYKYNKLFHYRASLALRLERDNMGQH